jgi:anti-sigma regulatory factor (Ser/Thr protein kinase)
VALKGVPVQQTAGVELACEPASAGHARSFVRRTLDSWGWPEGNVPELLVSEVVTNALIHARTPIRLDVRDFGSRVRVSVRDGSGVPPARRPADLAAASGRGLEIVEALASSWGVDPSSSRAGGKIVWFEVLRPGTAH